MHRIIPTFIACLAAAFLAASASAQAPSMELVGFTQTTHAGDVGLFTLHDACTFAFGREARVCTVEEAVLTVDPPVASADHGWLIERGHEFEACAGWRSAAVSKNAATTTDDGQFQRLSCDVARPAACCSMRRPM